MSRETRLKLKERILKYWCLILVNNIKNKGIRDITISKVKNHPRYTRQWEEKWLTNIRAWWCLPFPSPAEAWDSCLSSNARVQGHKKGHRKTSPVRTRNRTVLFQLKKCLCECQSYEGDRGNWSGNRSLLLRHRLGGSFLPRWHWCCLGWSIHLFCASALAHSTSSLSSPTYHGDVPFGSYFPSAATCLICSFLYSTFREMLGLEGASWDDLDTSPAPSTLSWSMLPRNMSRWVFNKSTKESFVDTPKLCWAICAGISKPSQ